MDGSIEAAVEKSASMVKNGYGRWRRCNDDFFSKFPADDLQFVNLGVGIFATLGFVISLVFSLIETQSTVPSFTLFANYTSGFVEFGINEGNNFRPGWVVSIGWFTVAVDNLFLYFFHKQVFLPWMARKVNYLRWVELGITGGIMIYVVVIFIGINETVFGVTIAFLFNVEVAFLCLHEIIQDVTSQYDIKHPTLAALLMGGVTNGLTWFIIIYYYQAIVGTPPAFVLPLFIFAVLFYAFIPFLLYQFTRCLIREYTQIEVWYKFITLLMLIVETLCVVIGLS
jgi:Heliorhodopsin